MSSIEECIKQRGRLMKAIEQNKAETARHLLYNAYLPVLSDYLSISDPAQIEAAITTLEQRLDKGYTLEGNTALVWKYTEPKHTLLVMRLLTEYETLYDCWSLQFEGTPAHPANYLMERIRLTCPVS